MPCQSLILLQESPSHSSSTQPPLGWKQCFGGRPDGPPRPGRRGLAVEGRSPTPRRCPADPRSSCFPLRAVLPRCPARRCRPRAAPPPGLRFPASPLPVDDIGPLPWVALGRNASIDVAVRFAERPKPATRCPVLKTGAWPLARCRAVWCHQGQRHRLDGVRDLYGRPSGRPADGLIVSTRTTIEARAHGLHGSSTHAYMRACTCISIKARTFAVI